MKRLFFTCILTLVLCSSVLPKEFPERSRQAGFYAPVYGTNHFDSDQKLKKVTGLNLLLGYTKKTFFYPVELNDFNPFWHNGTFLFFIPYIGIGTEYINENGFFASFHTVYIFPLFNVGYYF
jgi:hypothetical protein